MKTLFLSLVACSAFAQTAVFPGAVVTDNQLAVAANGVQTALVSAITSSATSMQVGSATGITANMILSIDSERVWTCNVVGTVVSIGKSSCPNIDGRGIDGSVAATHNSSAVVSAYIDAWHHNATRKEVEAIEAATIGNLVYSSAYYLTLNPSSTTFGIQEAINAACAATPAGGTVVIPNGTYNGLASTITLSCSNLTLRAQTPHGVVINRTGDFGDSIATATGTNIHVSGINLAQTINYAAGPPPTIVNRPTSGAHFRFYHCNNCSITNTRAENLVYGIEVDGTGIMRVEHNQVVGLWDNVNSNAQVTIAGIYLHNSAVSSFGYPTYARVVDNNTSGYSSAPRTITINGTSFPNTTELVGPRYGLWIGGCEVCSILNNNFEAGNGSGIHIGVPSGVGAIQTAFLDVLIDGNYIDSNRLYGIDFDMSVDPSARYALNFRIQNNRIGGGNSGLNGIYFAPPATPWTFVRTAATTLIQNNELFFFASSAIQAWSSERTIIQGNHFSNYNELNAFPTNSQTCDASGCSGDRLGNSAVYISGAARQFQVTGNTMGGDFTGAPYNAGAGVYTLTGVGIGYYSSYGASDSVTSPNMDGGTQAVASRSPALPFDPGFLPTPSPSLNVNTSTLSIAGCSATLGAGSTIFSGSVTSGTTGTCGWQLTITPGVSTTGWACSVQNITRPGGTNAIYQNANVTNSVSFTGTTVTADVMAYQCRPY